VDGWAYPVGVSGRNGEPGRSVLNKSFAILKALQSAETGLTRAQLSRRTGLPMTTVHRLATELRANGALELTEGGNYRIGPWLWELGTLAAQRVLLREIAIPYMEDLYEATHENVQLAVLDGHDALYLERIHGPRSLPILTRVGGRLPLHATGVGKALLAYAPPEFAEEVIGRGLQRMTPNTITDPELLRRDLAEVRRRGFAVTREEMTLRAVSVAAPIRGPDDEVIAAVSLVVNARGADVSRLAPAVQTVARSLSRRVSERWDLIVRPVDGPLAGR
jgi:DNA-binding IclR family transcriptional regulator